MTDFADTPALGGFGILALEGRDAGAFAQAQFCNDVRALEVGRWQWNGWLSAKGRVQALFALLRVDEASWWAILPDMPAESLAEGLQRFVFRSKLSLVVRDDLQCVGTVPAQPFEQPATAAPVRAGTWCLDMGTTREPRALLVQPRDECPTSHDAVADSAWRLFDVRHGFPRLDPHAEQTWTPQMLSLDRLGAYSVKKGCYPGQEVVARTHFLGKAKRGLVRLRSPAPLWPGATVAGRDGQALGPLVCVAADGDGAQALAVLPLDPTGVEPVIDGHAVELLPLVEGLSR